MTHPYSILAAGLWPMSVGDRQTYKNSQGKRAPWKPYRYVERNNFSSLANPIRQARPSAKRCGRGATSREGRFTAVCVFGGADYRPVQTSNGVDLLFAIRQMLYLYCSTICPAGATDRGRTRLLLRCQWLMYSRMYTSNKRWGGGGGVANQKHKIRK